MIQTDHNFVIDAPIADVWDYVSDIAHWASSMPGYESFEPVDEIHSKWVLKVALGALTKTVKLDVTITEEREPDFISFTLAGESEPVGGHGTFSASPAAQGQTAVAVTLAIRGSGPMAATMEAMSRPVVPRMTRSVSDSLKTNIEYSRVGLAPPPKPSWRTRLLRWLSFGGRRGRAGQNPAERGSA